MTIHDEQMDHSLLSAQHEKLVQLNGCSERIEIHPAYFLKKMPGTSPELFLRERVAQKLIRIAEKLPSALHLVLIDGWRSYETQSFIYETTIKLFVSKGYSQEKIKEEISKFVARPSKSLGSSAPHYSGGAIDLTLANEQGWLDMGTDFDDFTEKARADYYEQSCDLAAGDQQIRENRRFLTRIMESAGFVPNPTEWWHYSYGDKAWAAQKQAAQLYGGIDRGSF
ncbi:MAG: M15 family metallopeptidase [Sporolactobacillus sp.]